MAAEREQRRGADIAGVRAEGDGLDDIGGGANTAACDERNAAADALVAQALVHGGERKLDGDADVIADARGRGARTAAVAVDGDDVRAAAGDAAGDGGDVMHRRDLHNDRLFILRRFLERIDELA